jgi:hypothetical protein
MSEPMASRIPAGPGADGELVGAEQVHEVLRGWLRECSGPQVPLASDDADGSGGAEGPAAAVG